MNLIEILDIKSTNNLLIIANIVLIIFAVFLFVKLRKSIVKREEVFESGAYPKKEDETDFTGIADIKPEEFNPERFDLNKSFYAPATTPKTTPMEIGSSAIQASAAPSLDAVVNDAGLLKTDELELEDELPEEFDLSQVDSPVIPQPEPRITIPEKEEEKLEEKVAFPPEPEITTPKKEEEMPKEDLVVPPEPRIAVPEKEEEKPKVEFVVPQEPKIAVPEKEEEKAKVEFVVPPEPKIAVAEKEEEKQEEMISAPPELKLFSLDEKKRPEEIAAPTTPEVKMILPGKEEMKPIAKITSSPEIKLFSLDEKKKPEEISAPASTESITTEKADEQKVKKASKRKSLF